ncbi:hypothetical protein HIM_04250 [Hirsutella minnesotensis 3608]|uniref:FAD-binding domain-containing protein n=1 Tax=Hirsutella minnesotensis 3608 TaxID=1043627 RepID=A0A0F7ZLL3_9HYPO|nr:hypothetical protein HIM_04250 [Hirsutella minnesotensis 3608]
MATGDFRVVIVGGGPVGLTTAHALSLAGIDFVLLEQRHDHDPDVGASLVLGPNSMRVMHQLGLFDALTAVGSQFGHQKVFNTAGRELKNTTATAKLFRKNHGTAPVLFYRAELMQVLQQGLSDEARGKILMGKKIVGIASDSDGVCVSCADGTTYTGSMVLGADGVHSKTRRLMRELALETDACADWDRQKLYTSTYRAMWFSFPRTSKPGEAFETQHKDRAVVYFTSRDRGWVLLTERLPHPTEDSPVYEEKDISAFADRFAEFPVSETLKVKDVFAVRKAAGMSDLAEGLARHWSWGRIVLAGDSCHKFTPNSGLGFNNGVQDVVALCNQLHKLTTASKGVPDMAALTDSFQRYQVDRRKALRPHAFVSTHLIRANTWTNTPYYLLARYIMASKRLEYLLLKLVVSRFIRNGLVLDYVRAEEPFLAAVSWKHPLKGFGASQEGQ